MTKDWSTQKMRHYENKLAKKGNSTEILLYYNKVQFTENRIKTIWCGLIERETKYINNLNEVCRRFDLNEIEKITPDIELINSEIAAHYEAINELLKKGNEIKRVCLNKNQEHRDALGKQRSDLLEKDIFCYDRCVKLIGEEFEKENIPDDLQR